MTVFINSQPKQFSGKNNIAQLVQFLDMNNTNGIALAVNNKIIPKADWAIVELKENDNITLLKATQGG